MSFSQAPLHGPQAPLEIRSADHLRNGDEAKGPSAALSSRGFWGRLKAITATPGEMSTRKLVALNAGLERAWKQNNPVSWAIARVRCEVLRLTPHELAADHGHLPHSTLQGLESTRDLSSARYNSDTVTLLLRGWDDIAARRGDARTTRLINEAKEEVISQLTARLPSRTYAKLLGWRYLVGVECFHDSVKLEYKNLWARCHALQIPDFSTVLSYGRTLGCIPATSAPPRIWKNKEAAALRDAWIEDSVARERPRELARLHTILAAARIPVTVDQLGPASEAKLFARTVASLARFEPLPWDSVASLYDHLQARGLMSSDEVSQARDAWLAEDRSRPALACTDLQELAQQQGLPNSDLADALGIPERLTNKPSLPVFRTLAYDEPSSLAPFGTLAHLICADDTQLERILEKKRLEIATDLRRVGSTIQSPIAVERKLWNVSYGDLPYEKREIQLLEWRGKDPSREREISDAVRSIGESKTTEAIARLLQAHDTSKVAAAIRSLVQKHGLAPLEEKLRSSVRLIKAISLGEEIPSLPRLKELLNLAAIPLSPCLELDWRLKSAQHQALYCQSELERAVNCHVLELADSRRALLSSSGIPSHRASRDLIHLSATSAVSPKSFRRTLARLGVPPESEREQLFRSLLSGGTLSSFVSQRINAASDEAQLRDSLQHAVNSNIATPSSGESLENLRRKRRGELTADPRLDRALDFLRNLPGVTCADISRALAGDSSQPEIELHRSLIQQATSRRLPKSALPFVVADNVALVRKQPGLIFDAVRAAVPSPAFPLGVAAALAAKDQASLQQHLAEASTAVSEELKALGVPVTELAVQMRIWGVRPSDLKVPQKELQSALWSSNHEVQQRALELINTIRLEKAGRSLERIALRERIVSPSEIVRCARETVSGGDKAIHKAAKLPFGAAIDFESGAIVPPLFQLRTIASLGGIPFTQEMTAHWAWTYADWLRRVGHSPASRMLVTNILLSQQAPTATGRASDVDAIRDFIDRAGLPKIEYHRAFRRLRDEGQLTKDHAAAILGALGHEPKSPHGLFLAACTSSASVPEALSAWASRASGQGKLSSAFDSLFLATAPSAAESSVPVEPNLEALVEKRLAASSLAAPPQEAFDLALVLAGAVPAEIQEARLEILETRANQAREQHGRQTEKLEERARVERERKRTQAQVVPTAAWSPSDEQLALPFDTRITLLANRLRGDIRVTPEETLALFPHERRLIEPLVSAFGQDLAWFVGLLDAYKYPDYALSVMKEQLRSGLVPKNPGKVCFLRHMEWLDSRGSTGKLNEASLKLSFEERFVPPTPFKPRRD